MKNVLIATAFASTLLIEPAVAGSLSDPVLDSDVVAQAAAADSSSNIDGLMLALLYIIFVVTAAGAF